MKPFATSLRALIAVTLVAWVSGNDERVASECTIALKEGEEAQDKLYDDVMNCMLDLGYQHMGANVSTEEFRSSMRDFCRDLPALARCLDGVSRDIDTCTKGAQRTQFRLLRRYAETAARVECGADLTRVFEAFRLDANGFLADCHAIAAGQTIETGSEDPNAYMVHQYGVIRKIKQCLDERKGRDYDSAVDLVTSMCTQMMDEMKCVQGEEEVLCKSIVADGS